MNYESMLQVLKTVGSIPAGCRLGHHTGSTLFISPPGWLDSARRTVMGEGRHRTCATIQGLLTAAAERMNDMEHSRALDDSEESQERQELYQRVVQLHEALTKCSRGMVSLQSTYAMDQSVTAQLDVLINKCTYLGERAFQLSRMLARQGGVYGV